MNNKEVEIYPFITTHLGKEKISLARTCGVPLNLTHIAVGDGGGTEYSPTKEQKVLKNGTWRDEINRKIIHPTDPNIVIITVIIPDDVGGFFIRELSIIDEEGDTEETPMRIRRFIYEAGGE